MRIIVELSDGEMIIFRLGWPDRLIVWLKRLARIAQERRSAQG